MNVYITQTSYICYFLNKGNIFCGVTQNIDSNLKLIIMMEVDLIMDRSESIYFSFISVKTHFSLFSIYYFFIEYVQYDNTMTEKEGKCFASE